MSCTWEENKKLHHPQWKDHQPEIVLMSKLFSNLDAITLENYFVACFAYTYKISTLKWKKKISRVLVYQLVAAIKRAVSRDGFITSCSFKMAGDESGATLGQPHLARQDLNSLVSLDFLYTLWGLSLVCSWQFVLLFFFPNVAVQRPLFGWVAHTSRHPAHDAMVGEASERARESLGHYCSFSILITLLVVRTVAFVQRMRIRDVILKFDLMPFGFFSFVLFPCVNFIVSTVASLKWTDLPRKLDHIQIRAKLQITILIF